jgi:F0F1-type ATP synthase epsilon subunit
MLKIGELHYRQGDTVSRLVISWCFAEVLPDRVIVLAERGFLSTKIDVESAERDSACLSSHDPEFARVLEESIALINAHTHF